MNKLKSIVRFVLFLSVALILGTSCSDDDKPVVVQPSRVIKKVMIYQSSDQTKFLASLIFSYDAKGRLTQLYSKEPLSIVNYTYGDEDKVTYNYSSSNSSLVEVNTTLENGRTYSCSFSNRTDDINYLYNDGYLKTAKNGNLELKYTWENKNLKSITSSPSTLYTDEFNVSNVSNDYSIDLNTLILLMDGRADYKTVMNVYGQMAGLLGYKTQNVAENTDYLYDYSFYQDGRLKLMTLVASGEAYTFRIEYNDAVLAEN